MEIFILALLTALAFIIIMVKIGLRKFLRFGWQSDVVISGIIVALFFGTFTGMVTGLIAGIVISLFLSVAKSVARITADEP